MKTTRILVLPLVAVAGFALVGCTYITGGSGRQNVEDLQPGPAPAGDPTQTLALPDIQRGEAVRLIYNAGDQLQPATGSAEPSETGYILETACVATEGNARLFVELTDADDPSLIILTDIVPCNGIAQIDDAIDRGVPARNVRVSFTNVDNVQAAYSILTQNPS